MYKIFFIVASSYYSEKQILTTDILYGIICINIIICKYTDVHTYLTAGSVNSVSTAYTPKFCMFVENAYSIMLLTYSDY